MATQADIKSNTWTLDLNNPGKIVQGLADIKQCVYIIATTQKGTDPLRPDFGCSAFEFVDAPVNRAVPKIVKSIHDALEKYETRIENVKVTAVGQLENLVFQISYSIKNTTDNDQLNITYGSRSST